MKNINIVVLVVGIVLLAMGLNEVGTFGSRLGRALGGGLSERALAFFIAGGVCTVFGLTQTLKK